MEPKSRYTWTLSPELLDKAEAELNEPRDNEKRLEEIDKLREAFREKYPKHELICNDDGFLLRFLRAKKFDQEKALTTLGHYHIVRRDEKEIFDRVENPVLLKNSMSIGYCYMMQEKDFQGRAVLIYRDGMLSADVDMIDVLALFILGLEKALEDEEFQISGLCTVEDMDNINMRIMARMSTSVMRKMTYITQDAMPIRYKLMHMVNEGKVFDVFYKLFKPFIGKKLRERIILHGKDFSKLHEQIDRRYLPDFLGGDVKNPTEVGIKWGEELLEWKESGLSTDL